MGCIDDVDHEKARYKAALITICDGRQTANEARTLATHALQDGHTVMATPRPSADPHAECSYALCVADKIRHKLERAELVSTVDLRQWWNLLLGNIEDAPGAPEASPSSGVDLYAALIEIRDLLDGGQPCAALSVLTRVAHGGAS